MSDNLALRLAALRACRICVETPMRLPMPHEPLPIVQASASSRVQIVSQAPGTRAHASGVPFMDASGQRLRAWLGVSTETFYDPAAFAILPMGFCFPGQDAKGGDLPPRRECAPAWRRPLLEAMPQPRLTVALGLYALRWHLVEAGRPDLLGPTLDAMVGDWRRIFAATRLMPLPHPSWRNTAWLKRNPWFEAELSPVLQAEVQAALAG